MPAPTRNRKKWSAALGRRFRVQSAVMGVLMGLGCLAILLKQVDLKQSWNALGRLNGPYMLIPAAVFFVNLPLRAWRWRLIFPASWRPSLGACLTVLASVTWQIFCCRGARAMSRAAFS